MRRMISVLLIISFTFLAVSVHAQEKDTRKGIAVLDFKPSGVSASEASFITEFFRNALVSAKAFRLIDKSNMDRILAEQGFQQSGCTTQECAVQMGKMLNVQGMISGTFGLLFGEYVLTINLVKVETGEIIYSDTGRRKDPSQLQSLTDEMAARLAADQTGRAAPVKKAAPVVPVEPVYVPPARTITPAPTAAPPTGLPTHISTGFDGTITKVTGNQVTLNMGKLHGISKNQVMDIIAITEKVKSPISGQVTGIKTKVIGKVKITYIEAQQSLGTVTSLKTGYKAAVGNGIKFAGAKTFLLGFNGLWSPSQSETETGAMQEFDSYLEWRFSDFKINAGSISNNFLTATTAGQPSLGYLMFSLDYPKFGLGVGVVMYDGPGTCVGLRLGSEEEGNLKNNFYLGRGGGEKEYTGSLGEEYTRKLGGIIKAPDMHVVEKLELNFKPSASRKFRMYSLITADLGIRNFDNTDDYYVSPAIQNAHLSLIAEARIGAIFGMKFKLINKLSLSMGYGFYEYIILEAYDFIIDGSPFVNSTPSDFQTQVVISGVDFNITNNFQIGADVEMEFGGGSGGGDPQLRIKFEYGF